MTKKQTPKPTERELSILKILWEKGPCTVRQVHECMSETGYTTTLKLMQIMVDKSMLVRDESSKCHIYKPAAPQGKMQKQLLSGLMDKAFAGSTEKLVMRALTVKKVPPEELSRIRAMLDALEERQS